MMKRREQRRIGGAERRRPWPLLTEPEDDRLAPPRLEILESGEQRQILIGGGEEEADLRVLRRRQVPQGLEPSGQGLAIRHGRVETSRFQVLKSSEQLRHRLQVGIVTLRRVRRVPSQELKLREETVRQGSGGLFLGGQNRQPRAGRVQPARRQLQDTLSQNRQRPQRTAPAQRPKEALEPAEVAARQALPYGAVGHLRPFHGEGRAGEIRDLLGGEDQDLVVDAPPVQLLEPRQSRLLAFLLLLEAPLLAAHGSTATSSASSSSSRSSSSAGSTSSGLASGAARISS